MPAALRSVLAVVAGYVVTAVIVMAGTFAAMAAFGLTMTSVPTPPYLAANLAVSFLAAVAGGWVCARIAPARALAHGALLAALFLAMSLLPTGAAANGQPGWYVPVIAAIGVTGVISGALLQHLGAARRLHAA
jgi:hypothetical protein